MAEASATKQELEMLSADAHTAESFGRAIIASALAAAAAEGRAGRLRTSDQPGVNMTVTTVRGIGAMVAVPGFGTFCRIERKERLD